MPKKITLDKKSADREQNSIITGTANHNRDATKKLLKDRSARARDSLSDSYIKKLLKGTGYTSEQINENPQLIEDKRKEIKDRRDNPSQLYKSRRKSGFYRRREIAELKPGYVRGRIKSSVGYNGEEITEEMIENKRKELLYERANGKKPGFVKQTVEERRQVAKNTSDRRSRNLDDVYIKLRIKQSANYKGEEITAEMIQAHREKIKIYRERKQNPVKTLSYAVKLTDAYVRKLISVTKKIPKNKITDEQILIKRAEITARRARLFEQKTEKEKRAERKALREERKKIAFLAALTEANEKYQLKCKKKEKRELEEKERLEKKDAKKKAKAAAKKVKRLAKKVEVITPTPVYTFFTPYELRK